MQDRERLHAQLEAIRAQAVAIVASVDALIGPPQEEHCCETPRPTVTETYTKRTTHCDNCKQVLDVVSVAPEGVQHG